MKDYYNILGVERGATSDDIKKAFRKLAQKYHPDRKSGDEKKFKEVSEAYSVLGNEKKRREYDSYGRTFAGGGQGGGQGFGGFDFQGQDFDMSDLEDLFGGFSDFFGGAQRGQQKPRGRDISIDLELTFKESIYGTEKKVLLAKVSNCDTCEGSGAAPGSKMKTCTTCNGQGRIRETRNSILGTFQTIQPCKECHGTGEIPEKKCKTCKGEGVAKKEEEIEVTVPGGINDGEMIRMPQKGEAVKGGVAGDLYIKLHVQKHETFRKEGTNLVMDLPLKLTDALLGTTHTVKTLDDKEVEVKVPPMQGTEETLRVRNRGVPTEGDSKGDLLLRLSVAMPKNLSVQSKKLIQQLKEQGL